MFEFEVQYPSLPGEAPSADTLVAESSVRTRQQRRQISANLAVWLLLFACLRNSHA